MQSDFNLQTAIIVIAGLIWSIAILVFALSMLVEQISRLIVAIREFWDLLFG